MTPYFLSRYGPNLAKNAIFTPFFHPNPIVVAILVFATRLPFVPIKSISCVEEISIQKTAMTPYVLSRYGPKLAKNAIFTPFFHPNPFVVATLVFATRLPFVPIKCISCVEEISMQKTAMTPYFLSRYGPNLAKNAIFTQFFTQIQS